MNTAILRYLASKLMDDVRNGALLQEEIYNQANSMPLIEHLRRCVHEDDRQAIFNLFASPASGARRLAASLIYSIQQKDDIVKLYGLWQREKVFKVREALTYSILNTGEATDALKRELLAYLDDNEELYRKELTHFYGDSPTGTLLARLECPSHGHKKILYTHSLGLLGNSEATEQLEKYVNTPDTLLSEIAEKAIRRIKTRHGDS